MQNIKNIVALITPFNEDRSIDYPSLKAHLSYLRQKQASGFFVNATTGEFTNLTFEEKKSIAKFVLDNSFEIPVYMNVSSTVFEETIELSRFAKENGFYAVVSPPPFFLVPSQKGIIEYFNKIAEESSLPTFLYNIPQATGYSISVETIKELVKNPLIKGIKVTYDNMNYLLRLIFEVKSIRPDFEVVTGSEQLYIPLLLTGGDGGVMALANIALDIFNEVRVALLENNLSKISELQKHIARLTYIYSLSSSFGYAIKIALGYMGSPVKRFVRPPLQEDEVNESEFLKILKEVGLV